MKKKKYNLNLTEPTQTYRVMKSAIDLPLTAPRLTAGLEHFQDSYLSLVSFQRTKRSSRLFIKGLAQRGPREKVRRLKIVSVTSAFYTSYGRHLKDSSELMPPIVSHSLFYTDAGFDNFTSNKRAEVCVLLSWNLYVRFANTVR